VTKVPRSLLKHVISAIAALAATATGDHCRAGPDFPDRPAQTMRAAGSEYWPGKAAPEFALYTLDGRSVKLSSLRGKVVLLNFWATWCAPCRVEMPWLVDFSRRYQGQGLEIVGVSVDDGDRERVAAFVRARNVNYTIVLKDKAVSDAYGGLRFLPQTFFIGRDGKVVKRTYGVRDKDDFENDIRQALATPPRT
jgi:peroxiredoxin